MEFVLFVIQAYTYMVFASVIVSWIQLSPDNPVVSLLHTFTEPPLNAIRKFMPDTGGLDFSPMVLIFALYGIRRVIVAQMVGI
ncbi:MAG: YggT family protein [Myxococcota bacterium]